MTITVVVDDSDPAIEYSGPWATDIPNDLLSKSLGNTLHNATFPPDMTLPSFTYRFNGTMIRVFALIESVGDIPLPYYWSCELNGVATQPLVLPTLGEPSIIQICFAENSEDAENELAFYYVGFGAVMIDYLEYLPLNSTIARSYAYTSISADDASLIYNGGQPSDQQTTSLEFGIQIVAVQPLPGNDPYLALQFTGTSISVISVSLPYGQASFSIDDQTATIITGPEPLSDLQNDIPGTILWQSKTLSGASLHDLTVSNLNTVPGGRMFIGLQALVITNGTVPALVNASANATITPSLTLNPQPTDTAAAVFQSTRSYRTHSIIGGTVAGVMVILYIAVALALRCRRTRLRRARELHPAIQPFNLHPFTLIRRRLLHASDRVLKGRIVPSPPIIPSKFRNIENAIANLANAQTVIPQPRSSSHVPGPLLEPSPPLLNIPHLREQDSGLRMVEEDAEEATRVIVLPPEYTAT